MMEHTELLLAFYGDDFTGSTDAMESLSSNGYRTVLFLEPPSNEMLEKFEGIQCIGVAGTSRAKAPEEMEAELRPVFERFAEIGAKITHYKTCSTFDSSPQVGSIGKAVEVAKDYFIDQKVIPLLVGAPPLGRYTLFGNHFARMHNEVYRLDRHPVMSRHPVTPMNEADLRVHLSGQSEEKVDLMSILDLEGPIKNVRKLFEMKMNDQGMLLFDVLDEERLKVSGQLIWEQAVPKKLFVVGSSGMGYALTAHWKAAGVHNKARNMSEATGNTRKPVLAVSGSASPVTQKQITNAIEDGFYGIKVTPEQITDSEEMPLELIDQAVDLINEGTSVIFYTAMGPDDSSIKKTRELFANRGVSEFQSGEIIGKQLGRWSKEIIKATGITRGIVAGGDTSGFVTRELGIYGLEVFRQVSPGAPLCQTFSYDDHMNGFELALKGGQLGGLHYFSDVRDAE
jgi:3-oxoisoapionate kinase